MPPGDKDRQFKTNSRQSLETMFTQALATRNTRPLIFAVKIGGLLMKRVTTDSTDQTGKKSRI